MPLIIVEKNTRYLGKALDTKSQNIHREIYIKGTEKDLNKWRHCHFH